MYNQYDTSYGANLYNEKPIKYTKSQIYQGVRDFAMANTGVMVQKEDKIDELPDRLRHACSTMGVIFLEPCFFPIPEMGLTIQFYFCSGCGKIYLPKDIF